KLANNLARQDKFGDEGKDGHTLDGRGDVPGEPGAVRAARGAGGGGLGQGGVGPGGSPAGEVGEVGRRGGGAAGAVGRGKRRGGGPGQLGALVLLLRRRRPGRMMTPDGAPRPATAAAARGVLPRAQMLTVPPCGPAAWGDFLRITLIPVSTWLSLPVERPG